MTSRAESGWYGISLSTRYHPYTYRFYPGDDLPPVDVSKFADINNLTDLEAKTPDIRSVTACYFQIDHDSGIFYRDQQDCVIWRWNAEDGQVYTPDGVRVARSLPEFLARIDMENRIWFKENLLSFIKKQEDLTPEEEAYLEFYSNQK